ncbi:MAG: multiheme c-type cytochrome [Salinibacter sp.]|uniref:multiheme c-type cytochrome n=1 Tax=Salinibacter sp. TaxID=2065818 RepID=UPI0035D45155
MKKWKAKSPETRTEELVEQIADSAHLALYQGQDPKDYPWQEQGKFPSAETCATCHPRQYKQWSASPHAYAQLSPVFNAFNGKLIKLTNGTMGDFCIRCHTPTGLSLGEKPFMSNMKRHPTSREGVTCVVCHRLKMPYGKISGRFAMVKGDIFTPVFGPKGGEEVKRVTESDSFQVNTKRGRTGRAMHKDAIEFAQISEPAFCGTCHDVNALTGFRLEEAFSEYKSTPAADRSVSCQDCHMGKKPGVDGGYTRGPAAIVGGKPTKERKLSNHMIAGPDYPIVHPGIFPHNVRADRMASIQEWLKFDVEAGWGTDSFEKNVPEGYDFPKRWEYAADRYAAREVIEENQNLLKRAKKRRMAVMRAGFKLGEIKLTEADSDELAFKVAVRNGTTGHNVPTGFDAERIIFLQVRVTDANGKQVFVSGDRDPNGDLRDLHSLYVHNEKMPLDKQLFSLQSRFLTRMVRGGEREQILAVNYSGSPLPFVRPPTRSTLLTGRPTGARKHRRTISPNDEAWADYEVPEENLEGTTPPYTARIKLIAQMVPANLIYAIKDVGFDYNLSPREVADRVVEGALTLYDWKVKLSPEERKAKVVSKTP